MPARSIIFRHASASTAAARHRTTPSPTNPTAPPATTASRTSPPTRRPSATAASLARSAGMGRRGTDRRRSCEWKGRVSRHDIAGNHLGCILLKMEAVSLLTGVTDMWCTNVTRTNISLRTLGVPSGPDDQPRGTFVRAGAVLRSEQQRHLERPALHGGGYPPHRSQRPNRPLLHVCETYPRPTFLSILPPFTFPTFRSRDVKCVREQVPGAAAEPRAAASGAALHGDVPAIAVLGPTHHERYVHLLWATTLPQPLSCLRVCKSCKAEVQV